LWLLLKLPFMILRVIPHVGAILRGEAATDSGARARSSGEELTPVDDQAVVHAAGRAGSAAATVTGVQDLQSVDPGFDVTAFLDSARIAVGAYAMAHSAQDDRLLRRITTSGYWQTPNGKALAAGVAEWQRYAGDRPGAANRGRMVLDISWRQPEVKRVALGDQGMDRITVRLASVIAGAAGPGWQRTDGVTRFDWDFVRPAGQRTDPAAVLLPRTCAGCGGPYRSDLDDACPYCHAARPGPTRRPAGALTACSSWSAPNGPARGRRRR
jgi:hypothetical protein